jgi:hypothetical protein
MTTITRRAMLGAIPAVAVLPSVPALADAAPTDWNGRWDCYLATVEAVDQYDREVLRPARNIDRTSYFLLESGRDDLVGVQTHALTKMLLTPAPTMQAVAIKIREVIRAQLWDGCDIEDVMETLLADVRSLGGC